MKIAMISFTLSGCQLGQTAAEGLRKLGHETKEFTKSMYTMEQSLHVVKEPLSQWTKQAFSTYDAILFIGACGIAVRSIAPYVKDKKTDPAVVVMDEQGKHVISLLSGHLGGANELTIQIARLTGASPVITTATDINGKFAVDVFAKKNQCSISSMKTAKEISAALVAGEQVGFYSTFPVRGSIPSELLSYEEGGRQPEYGIAVSCSTKKQPYAKTLFLVPRVVTMGIGCRRGTSVEKIEQAVGTVLEELGVPEAALEQVASIDVKKEEAGLLQFCGRRRLPFVTYSAEQLTEAEGTFTESEFVKKQVGVGSVCERSAVLASKNGKIIRGKYACDGVTVACAVREWSVKFE